MEFLKKSLNKVNVQEILYMILFMTYFSMPNYKKVKKI